jgi:hypothetical protein
MSKHYLISIFIILILCSGLNCASKTIQLEDYQPTKIIYTGTLTEYKTVYHEEAITNGSITYADICFKGTCFPAIRIKNENYLSLSNPPKYSLGDIYKLVANDDGTYSLIKAY